MEQLVRQVRRAQRWLGLQRFLGALGWCCCTTLLLALGLIVVEKFWPLGVGAWVERAATRGGSAQLEPWVVELLKACVWGGAALGLGLVAAVVWAVIRGRGPIDAAIEIDRRFGLKERVSSALAMSEEERGTPSGQAVVDDAARRVRRIEVGQHFGISPGRQILLPLIPAVLAILVALFVTPAVHDKQAQATTNPEIKKQVEASTKSLLKKLREQREQARREDLKDAQDLFKRLEEGLDDLVKRAKPERKEALVKLNDLAREIRNRREQLGGAEKVQEQLNKLKNVEQGPGDKFVKAVQQGDFKQAVEELEKLKTKLAEGNLTDEEKQQLANQLKQMEEKLNKLAEAHRQAMRDLQQAINQARQAGRQDEAAKLQEQLSQLKQQGPQMNQLQSLASQLGQCSQCLRKGQLQDANNTLGQLQTSVAGLREQLKEMEMLDQAMSQLSQCRNQMCGNKMGCANCGGRGCGLCQGMGFGQGQGQGDKRGGRGMGEGRGAGDRPEEKTEVNFFDANAKVKVGLGPASIVDQVEGPNSRGEVQQEIREQFRATRSQSADPVRGQQMSRQQREHALEYFDRFREGQ